MHSRLALVHRQFVRCGSTSGGVLPFLKVDVVSNQDLYDGSEYIHANRKIPYRGRKPSLYPRYATEPPKDRNVCRLKDTRLLSVLEGTNKGLVRRVQPRTEALHSLVGADFELSTADCVAVLCGKSEIDLKLVEHAATPNVVKTINTSKLRQLGESIYRLVINQTFIFTSEQYLSSSFEEINSVLQLLEQDKVLIPIFMKKTLLYEQLFPFRGISRHGFLDPEESERMKTRILDATSIGSFYTLLGLLIFKYGKDKVVDQFIMPRVLNGQSGIVNIATDLAKTQR